MNRTSDLIIIGYSFPEINREIDQDLFSNCNFNKIVIQDKHPNKILSIVKNLFSNNGCVFELVDNTDEFYVPPNILPYDNCDFFAK